MPAARRWRGRRCRLLSHGNKWNSTSARAPAFSQPELLLYGRVGTAPSAPRFGTRDPRVGQSERAIRTAAVGGGIEYGLRSGEHSLPILTRPAVLSGDQVLAGVAFASSPC